MYSLLWHYKGETWRGMGCHAYIAWKPTVYRMPWVATSASRSSYALHHVQLNKNVSMTYSTSEFVLAGMASHVSGRPAQRWRAAPSTP